MNGRGLLFCCALFGFGAALGAGFAMFGPVAFVRVLGAIAFLGGAAGCALQLYALREFAPQSHVLLRRRMSGGFVEVGTSVSVGRPVATSG
jgi:hypothetical protein